MIIETIVDFLHAREIDDALYLAPCKDDPNYWLVDGAIDIGRLAETIIFEVTKRQQEQALEDNAHQTAAIH